jgi:hypothetical protein
MREPKANHSKEAIKLRTLAVAWAKCPIPTDWDKEDKEGMRLNRALLKAAIAYAKVAENV